MFNLFILLLERVGLIIIIAYLLMNTSHFKTMMGEREKWRSQWQLLIIFAYLRLLQILQALKLKMVKLFQAIFIII